MFHMYFLILSQMDIDMSLFSLLAVSCLLRCDLELCRRALQCADRLIQSADERKQMETADEKAKGGVHSKQVCTKQYIGVLQHFVGIYNKDAYSGF